MLENYSELLYGYLGKFPSLILWLFLIWALFWKGLSLWKSARNKQKYWFVALLILNTAAILDIAYIAFFQRKRK
jgi:uncharacterized BrkB/YihY/UPF0761 family membrane protein